MLPRLLITAAAFAVAASPIFAQDRTGVIQRWPTKEAAPAPAPAPAPQPPPERVAVPRRNPPPSPPSQAGRDRDNDRDRNRDRRGGTTNVYVAPRPLPYGYSYPRSYYPYGYGAFGLGYFYYDPYTWYSSSAPPIYAYGSGPNGRGYYGRGYNYDIGEIRLRVTPRDAQVFVDGYFAGTVDDYDGVLQALRLESGPYDIELRMPGYQTEAFKIRVNPGQKITYRAELRRLP